MKKAPILLLLLIVLAASPADVGPVIRARASCDVSPYPLPRCAGRCLTPGECNKCCKALGYPRGKCIALGCTCCTTPSEAGRNAAAAGGAGGAGGAGAGVGGTRPIP